MPYTEQKIGYQKTDTSESAARDNVQWKMTAKERVLQLLQKVPQSLTTEDISDMLNIPYATVQPRLSELRAEGKVEDSGSRGETKWGKSCIKWRSK